MKYVVGSVCSFSHNGKLYTEGMEISSVAFASEDDFKRAVKLGKIVVAPEDDEEKKEEDVPKEGKKPGRKKKDAEAPAGEEAPAEGAEAAADKAAENPEQTA